MKTKKNKAKIRVNKLDHNPLFIKFLNWKEDTYTFEKFLTSLAESFNDEEDKQVVLDKLNNLDDTYLTNIGNFKRVFKTYMTQAVVKETVSEEFTNWMNNAFKYVGAKNETYAKDESHEITIKDASGRWFEGIVIFNFIMTFNYFGMKIIKICPVCSSFFSHKGQYAKYCSDGCKTTGMKK